jgi:hypothetical protein
MLAKREKVILDFGIGGFKIPKFPNCPFPILYLLLK